MAIIAKLASSLNRRDELPNQELAKEIADKDDAQAVSELIEYLDSKNKEVQSDCIKVLYEIGAQKPKLIAGYAEKFVSLLDSSNNRLQWGAMTALDAIASENPETVALSLTKIIDIANKGSVITKDHAVGILIRLCSVKKFSEDAFKQLVKQLQNCPTNQLPMYAENAMRIINNKNKNVFVKLLQQRLSEIKKDTKRKRVEKVIKKLSS